MKNEDSFQKEVSQFTQDFKIYEEDKGYSEFSEQHVSFDASKIELKNITDNIEIMQEMNKISSMRFIYGSLYESQNNVLQQVEDEYKKWSAKKYFEIDHTKYKTEGAKEKGIIIEFEDEYSFYQKSILTEKYKLGLLKQVINSIDSYSYKLHALKDYNSSANKNY